MAPLRALQETDTLFVLDAVTSLGGMPVEVDAWGVDVAYSATQKCLRAVSGLAPVTFSERALAQVAGRAAPVPWFDLDVGRLDAYVYEPHRYHHTASSVAGLRAQRRLGPAPRRRPPVAVGTPPPRR